MTRDGYELLKREIQSGERLLWTGRPRQGVLISRSMPVEILSTLLLLVVPLLLVALSISAHAYSVAVVIALFFLVVAKDTITDSLLDPLERKHLYYGLTDRRAIICDTRGHGTTLSVRISMMTEVALVGSGTHSNTIVCVNLSDSWYRRNDRGEIRRVPLFRNIVEARLVYQLLLEANPALAATTQVR